MNSTQTLAAFTQEEFVSAHLYLATAVAHMMGRKLEEDDWSAVYCKAKDIPATQWSNLNIDVMHENLGVEHKMLRPSGSRGTLIDIAGTTQMHPAATRSIRIDNSENDPTDVMVDVFKQYQELIEQRKISVWNNSNRKYSLEDIDMRTGWLLWETELREFIYFEEKMIPPNPDNYRAEWNVTPARGSRKSSKSLWIYEKYSGKKRFSVTTSAGIKIQPYFDVPPPHDPNFYFFRVQGEAMPDGMVRIWVTAATVRELKLILGSLDSEKLSAAILNVAAVIKEQNIDPDIDASLASSILITKEAYSTLTNSVEGQSDEHRMQQFVDVMRKLS